MKTGWLILRLGFFFFFFFVNIGDPLVYVQTSFQLVGDMTLFLILQLFTWELNYIRICPLVGINIFSMLKMFL